jgi:chemotaxis protein MotB
MKTILVIIALIFAGVAYYFYDAKTKADSAHKSKITTISDEKEGEISQLKSTYAQLEDHLKNEIEQGQIKIIQLSDRLSVIMVDKVLFPSGEAEITPQGLMVLDRIGSVLKDAKNKIIRVEGYTDNVQIDKRLQKKYPTNWELSTARATNVVRFLQEKGGIKGEFLQPIGMSEYHPVASNETSEGRSQNRRIEISLLP